MAERDPESFLEAYNEAQAARTDARSRRLLARMRDQLLLVLIQRAGGQITVPVEEIDLTGDLLLNMTVDGGVFTFTVRRRH